MSDVKKYFILLVPIVILVIRFYFLFPDHPNLMFLPFGLWFVYFYWVYRDKKKR